ncbi:MAG: hypothetical protein O2857_00975 [Planctomycetota bacterium]|nr:hypothetical protein [Planctomycetota bacterium]
MSEPTSQRGMTELPIYTAAFLLGVFATGLIGFSDPDMVGYDGYYHMRYAEITRTHGIIREFPWAQFSIFNVHFSDKEFLFHLLLIPFTFGDLILGSKLASCLLGGCVFSLFYALLRALVVRWPFSWTALLLCAGPYFIFRLSMTRPHVLSLIFLLILSRLLHRRSYRWLGVMSVIYALGYSAPQLILILVVCFNIGLVIAGEKWDWRAVLFPAAGLLAGFLIHPNFPNNFRLWLVQNFSAPFHAWGLKGVELSQGSELDSLTGTAFLFDLTLASVAITLSLLGFLYRGKKPSARTWSWLIFAGALLGLTMLSQRFVEYFIPFALVFAAAAFTDVFEGVDLEGWFAQRRWAHSAMPVVGFFFFSFLGANTFLKTQSSVMSHTNRSVSAAADWMRENLPERTLVFHTQWSDFPELFFRAPELHYMVALDPVFMFEYDQRLWRLWDSISDGHQVAPVELICKEFGAHIVLVRRSNENFERQLRADANARRIFLNEGVSIYQLECD